MIPANPSEAAMIVPSRILLSERNSYVGFDLGDIRLYVMCLAFEFCYARFHAISFAECLLARASTLARQTL